MEIQIMFDRAAMEAALHGVAGWSWLFEWGMYLLLLAALGITLWVFFDSNTRRKGDVALTPRILSMVGVFLVIPAFIFRFTGTADAVNTRVRLMAEPGQPLYESAVNFNVNWLANGYGPIIALVALAGMLVSILSVIMYSSLVPKHKAGPSFGTSVGTPASAPVQNIPPAVNIPQQNPSPVVAPGGQGGNRDTVIEPRIRPAAVTIIDRPTVAILKAESGADNGKSWNLPAGDVTIGRNPGNVVILSDEKVSGLHAKLKYENGLWKIFDDNSSNGTCVNGSKIAGLQEITNGSLISVGDTTLVFSTIQ